MLELPKIFVKPGQGVKVPLPVHGVGSVPQEGRLVPRSIAVERLLRTKDLVEAPMPVVEPQPAPAPAAPTPAAPVQAAQDVAKVKG